SNVGDDSQVEDVISHNYSVSVDDQLVGMTEIDVRSLDTRAIAELNPEIIDADRIRRSEAYLSRTRRADLTACHESDLRCGAVALGCGINRHNRSRRCIVELKRDVLGQCGTALHQA